jgi:hypothetical protein
VVQLFSHCADLNYDHTNLNLFNSFGYSFQKNKEYANIKSSGKDYWHPGYAWAITRKAFQQIGGLFDKGVLGGGDNIMALSIIGKCETVNNPEYNADFNSCMLEFQLKANKLHLGYVPGVIRHHFHGSKINRKYVERWQILIKHQYSPNKDVTYDSSGILIPTTTFSEDFKSEIFNYFFERNEDE